MSMYKISQAIKKDGKEDTFLLSRSKASQRRREEGPQEVPPTLNSFSPGHLPNNGRQIASQQDLLNEKDRQKNGSFSTNAVSMDEQDAQTRTVAVEFGAPQEPPYTDYLSVENSSTGLQHSPHNEIDPTRTEVVGESPRDVEDNSSEEAAFEGVLAQDVRNAMLSNAVDAVDVRAADQPEKSQKMKCIPFVIIISIAFFVAGGVALGVSLGRSDTTKGSSALSEEQPPSAVPSSFPSAVPTLTPTDASFAEVAALIESTFGIKLQDSSSPQYQAAEWMSNMDNALDLSTVSPERFMQRYALVVFYYATGGDDSWIKKANFLSPDLHECDWVDATSPGAETTTGLIGVNRCTEQQKVDKIEIQDNNMTGFIPKEIAALSTIRQLNLNLNNLVGTLPEELFNLTDLELLWLPFNNFTGTIPTQIGNLGKLLGFWVERTSLTGTMPTEIGSASSLRSVRMSSGAMNGTIPETLFELPQLWEVGLNNNSFSGQFPPSFPLGLPNLLLFSADFNHLSGTVSNRVGSLPLLQVFRVRDNNLTGPFPESIAGVETLQVLDFSNNGFTGSLPSDWNRPSSTLTVFAVQGNQLTGTIPESFGNMTALIIFDVAGNFIEGTIPTEFGNLGATLQYLTLASNNLTGTVPETLLQLEALLFLALHTNEVVGDISFFCNEENGFALSNLSTVSADCFGEVVCPCCSLCCDENDDCVTQ